MYKNILQALENTSNKFPNKIAFADAKNQVIYKDFVCDSKKIGISLIKKLNVKNSSIIIYIDKTINCLETMMGVLYSGNFYTIIDTNSPEERVKNIINTLEPVAIITDNKNKTKFEKYNLSLNIPIILYEEAINTIEYDELINEIRDNQIDTDPMYVLFTSGSTGIPKGTVVSHKAVLSYINWVKNTFNINETTIFGSQTPFYFSMSITDVFTTILTGATLYIIPKMYFSFPIKLVEYMNEKKINTIYWVPSALCIVANLGILENAELPELKKILFAGEVMPVKTLNKWIQKFPNCMYANLFGPTETTDICSYYILDRKFEDNETLPIGKHCDNCNLIIIKEDGTQANIEEEGELLVKGSFLAYGYYNNPEKSKEAFIQNPLNTKFSETVYKTGDIVKYNKMGELIYISRKDYQIKHQGYRIELGEIEKNIYSIDEIVLCACIYDNENQKIILLYQGNIEEEKLAKQASEKLLPYMRPNKYIKVASMPYNSNGKIDRKELQKLK